MQWRRKNYLINKDFQFRYISRVMFGIIMMALVIAFTVYYTTWARIMDEFYHVPQIASQFAALFSSVNNTLIVILLLFLVISAFLSIFISHSIAGPVYRFEKTFKAIMAGDLTPRIGLRKSDEFRHLAETINDMLYTLRHSLSSDRKLVEEMVVVSKRLQSGKDTQKSGASAEVTKDLGKLNQLLNQLQQDVKRFKLKPE
ncbi:HAMP domain-containing protein [bacterium]|nr:HAMP domain-containing protein [bacterium]